MFCCLHTNSLFCPEQYVDSKQNIRHNNEEHVSTAQDQNRILKRQPFVLRYLSRYRHGALGRNLRAQPLWWSNINIRPSIYYCAI